jgi:hypothetical protein
VRIEIDKPKAASGVLEAVRVLRCTRTRRYWTQDGWRDQLAEAAKFSDEIDAARGCVIHKLKDVELVVCVPGGAEIFSTLLR